MKYQKYLLPVSKRIEDHALLLSLVD